MSRNSAPRRLRAALASAGAVVMLAAAADLAAQAPPTAAAPAVPSAPAVPGAAVTVPAPPAAPAAAGAPGQQELLVPSSEFRYDPLGRRDPFKSLLALEGKKRDVTQLPPIQQFDLETARVVGVITDPVKGAQAMVRAPNGQTFVVRKGTIIGKNEGEVVEISLKGIRVTEKFVDFMNRETRKDIVLGSHPTAAK